MHTLYVRNVPTKLYRRIQSLAESERRSLSAEVITLLDRVVSETSPEPREPMSVVLERIRAIRDSIKLPKNWPGSAALIREDRDR